MDENNADGEQAPHPFVPFTKGERLQQLTDVDQSIVSLLRSTGQAIQSLGSDQANLGRSASDDESDVFRQSLNSFFRTLRSVNVRLSRQIYGLEEDGIVTLHQEYEEEDLSKSRTKSSSLGPDGWGNIGGLDTGWLNSRSSKVERDMETELWDRVEAFLRDEMQRAQREEEDAETKTEGS